MGLEPAELRFRYIVYLGYDAGDAMFDSLTGRSNMLVLMTL